MTYRAPVADIAFALKHGAGFNAVLAEGLYGDLGEDEVDAVLEEAGKFATDVLAPLNTVGDRHGTPFKDGAMPCRAGPTMFAGVSTPVIVAGAGGQACGCGNSAGGTVGALPHRNTVRRPS